MSKSKPRPSRTPMTPEDAARIQSHTAKQHGGAVPPESFATRAQRAAEKNVKAEK